MDGGVEELLRLLELEMERRSGMGDDLAADDGPVERALVANVLYDVVLEPVRVLCEVLDPFLGLGGRPDRAPDAKASFPEGKGDVRADEPG